MRLVIATTGAFALTVLTALPVHGVPLTQISADPYTNPGSQHLTEVEPHTYAFGSTIVSTFQVGRFFGGGASNIGWATSTDDGASWVNGFLPGITKFEGGGPYDRVSDPAVAYDAAHDVWMISSLALTDVPFVRGAAVLVSRSIDGGLTWANPVTVASGGSGANLDKNWTVCDNSLASPFFGNCYTEWDDNGAGNLIKMSTSDDGGATWSPALTTADSASGLGGVPVVQPNGTVVVPYSGNFGSVRSFISNNGGINWSATVLVSSVQRRAIAGGLRAPPLPSAQVDGDGKVYVAWADCRFRAGCSSNDIVISASMDGLAWTAPFRVPIDDPSSPVDHFIPGLGVDPASSGLAVHLALAYYYYPNASCSAADCQLLAGMATTPDGGFSWVITQLTDTPMNLAWLASTSQGPMVGDYISTSHASNGTAHPVIAVANPPSAAFDEGMYTPVTGLAAAAGTLARRGDDPVQTIPGAGQQPPALPTVR
jgi:hypothetical protein